MFVFCVNAAKKLSGNDMPKRTIGLTLSYSF